MCGKIKKGYYVKFAKILLLITALCLITTCVFGKSITLNERNTVVLSGAVNTITVNKVIQEIMDRYNPITNRDIYLVLNTPGGDVNAGLMLIDALNSLHMRIHTITLEAASMGFITVQFLGTRYIIEHGTLMSHKMRGGFSSLEIPGQFDSRYSYWLRRSQHINEQIVKRTNGKHTMTSYNTLIENEYWCEGQDCINQGFADEIVGVVCSTSLMKESEDEDIDSDFYGSLVKVKVKISKCPLIRAGSILSVLVDGIPYNYTDIRINRYLQELREELLNGTLTKLHVKSK